MPHSFTKLWVHLVFSTKVRQPLISSEIETRIFNHMRIQFSEMKCWIKAINAMPDHIHILYLQSPDISVADVVKQVKGNTSHWINQQELLPKKFAWQTGYSSFSVSESQVDRVIRYIENQKEHHRSKSFAVEYDEFLTANGL